MTEEIIRLEEEHAAVFKQKIPEVEKLEKDIRVKKPPEIGEAAKHQAPRGVGGVQSHFQRDVQRQTVKMNPLDHPEFDGKTKTYLRFKKRFKELITPNFDSMGQLEFLEKAISKWLGCP